jgi:hypothetical protein
MNEWQFEGISKPSYPNHSKPELFKWGYLHGQWRALEYIKTQNIKGMIPISVIHDMLEELEKTK